MLALLRDGQWWGVYQIAEALGGMGRDRVPRLIKRLSERGHEFDVRPNVGVRLVREAPAPGPLTVRYQQAKRKDRP